MKRINRTGWLVLAALSFLVGTWVWISEGAIHSKFYVYYLFSALVFILLYYKSFNGRKITKRKKSR